MTISSHTRTVKGTGTFAAVGGNAINVTQTADNPMTSAMVMKDQVVNGTRRRVTVSTAISGVNDVRTALGSGSLAYNAPAQDIVGPMITDSVNGTANTSLKLTGSDVGQNRKIVKPIGNQFGAKVTTAFAQNAWTPLGIADQRTNWSPAAASVSAGGVLSTLSGTSHQSTTADAAAVDYAVGDIAVPGKLAYMDGSPNPTSDTYPVFTGP